MIYFIVAASIILGDEILKKYFKSTFQGKHRKEYTERKNEKFCKQGGRYKIELLENKGAASGILSSHPKLLKEISAVMLCFCALALRKEQRKGRATIAGIGYALILGGGISNFMDRVRKGSVTDYIRFPKFPVKKIRNLVFNLSDFSIFAGVFCLLFRRK